MTFPNVLTLTPLETFILTLAALLAAKVLLRAAYAFCRNVPSPQRIRVVAVIIGGWFLFGAISYYLFNVVQPYHKNPPIKSEGCIVYVPKNLDYHAKHPLVIALSPSGNAREMIAHWKKVADDNQWIILASRDFHNGIDWPSEWGIFQKISSDVRAGNLNLPIDQTRILASGISGGAWGSHHFAYYFRDFISGVVVNTGMMDDVFSPANKGTYPRNKFAVFLASPTDFRYHEMQHDQEFLKSLGWKTQWIEFQGGHTFAPQSAYSAAAQWVKGQWENTN